VFSGFSGYAAEALGYRLFYATTMVAGIPALLILWSLHARRLAPAAGSPAGDRHTLPDAQI
jgi:hypothetical protein